MARDFVSCDRGQVLLMPPSLTDWLPQEHLVWTILGQVTRIGCCGRRSGRSAEVLGEHLSGCPPSECLAWSTVQRRRDGCEVLGTVAGEVCASGEVLAQQPVGVLVGGALPGASWITEVDLQTAVEPELDVLGHLGPLVPGQGPPKLVGKRPDRVSDRVANGAGAGTRDRRPGPRPGTVVSFDRRGMQQPREPA